jgi:hypothetical protein
MGYATGNGLRCSHSQEATTYNGALYRRVSPMEHTTLLFSTNLSLQIFISIVIFHRLTHSRVFLSCFLPYKIQQTENSDHADH